MSNKLKALADFVNNFLTPEEIDNLSTPTLSNLFKSFDEKEIYEFFDTTPLEFIEDYDHDLQKGKKVPVGTVRGNFVKTGNGWKYNKKSPEEKEKKLKEIGRKKLDWGTMSKEDQSKKIDAAERRLKEAEEKKDDPQSQIEARALRLWLEKHKISDNSDNVEKGGPGSGQKGHHTDRKPYPGEEAHKMLPFEDSKNPKGMMGPNDLPMAHYSDAPMMKKYRELIKKLGPEMVEGRFHYHAGEDKIVATNEGKMLAQAAAGLHNSDQKG